MKGNLLQRLSSLKRNINIAVIGMGFMGKGLVFQSSITPGIKCLAVIDRSSLKARNALSSLKLKHLMASKKSDVHKAASIGAVAICEDPGLIIENELVDVVLEASTSIFESAELVAAAINSGKHVVMMNAEADQVFGPYLAELAGKNNVVYTSCDGDQPGVLKRLVDEMHIWGFKLIMAGNIKGYLNRYETPETIVKEADKRGLDHNMCCAFSDGTKLNIEMSLISNALGLSVKKTGMMGPKAVHVKDAPKLFDLQKILSKGEAVADYILGSEPGEGVFAIGHCDNPYQAGMMKYLKMGSGPFYVFYRPYHLCNIEAMRCIAEAYLDHTPLLVPEHGFKTNVIAYAKRDVGKGEELDGLGGFDCYGLIENSDKNNNGLPVCLSQYATLKHSVKKDGRIRLGDVNFKNKRPLELYKRALKAPIRRVLICQK